LGYTVRCGSYPMARYAPLISAFPKVGLEWDLGIFKQKNIMHFSICSSLCSDTFASDFFLGILFRICLSEISCILPEKANQIQWFSLKYPLYLFLRFQQPPAPVIQPHGNGNTAFNDNRPEDDSKEHQVFSLFLFFGML
jgi:hypothetical protein